MSRTRRFALSFALFVAAAVVTPVAVGLIAADVSLVALAGVSTVGFVLTAGVGYRFGTDDTAARIGKSRFGPAFVLSPATLDALFVGYYLLTDTLSVSLALVLGAGILVGFVTGVIVWNGAATEHAARARAGRTAVTTWEARPPDAWWRKSSVVVASGLTALIVSTVAAFTVAPWLSSLLPFVGGLFGGMLGSISQLKQSRSYLAYENGVAVEQGGVTAFYGWDQITAIDRTDDAVVLRRHRPWTNFSARSEDIDGSGELTATLRELRASA
ncbi:hypothetical protein C499_10659 [Halogeometricum borinquense DSM 11551]|uniref:YcxB family protein n=1 Tax=Halogeometricum borinquense (strain ATCC 700274 / DSM 11551 / JCM 10706 / KCTC 4070 / PR3) TaxID=469382 RepID=E4NRI3_HALBP|nr:YcxB family protein [Halogeometricum borinquense]ADQ65659.1 hypothetical protein Hbor_00460 [Halogeometricum borinquense DSM 11551]ELY26990.1 hypothetical protein C499_10659 [Halogeometricum borinquense DSM 11551]